MGNSAYRDMHDQKFGANWDVVEKIQRAMSKNVKNLCVNGAVQGHLHPKILDTFANVGRIQKLWARVPAPLIAAAGIELNAAAVLRSVYRRWADDPA